MSRMESTQGWVDRHKQTALQNYFPCKAAMAFIKDDASGTVWDLACRHNMRCLFWNLPVLPVHLLGLDTSDSILILKTHRSNKSSAMVFMFFEWKWSHREWHYLGVVLFGILRNETFTASLDSPKTEGWVFSSQLSPMVVGLVQHLGIQPKADFVNLSFSSSLVSTRNCLNSEEKQVSLKRNSCVFFKKSYNSSSAKKGQKHASFTKYHVFLLKETWDSTKEAKHIFRKCAYSHM